MDRWVAFTKLVSLALPLSLIATGCSNESNGRDSEATVVDTPTTNSAASEDSAAQTTGQDEVQPANKRDRIRYSCENGKSVIAEYVESGAMQQVANLEIDGKLIGLSEARSASGARYETDEGITPSKKLIWWTKGETAMLIESLAGDVDGSSETVINCDQVSG